MTLINTMGQMSSKFVQHYEYGCLAEHLMLMGKFITFVG